MSSRAQERRRYDSSGRQAQAAVSRRRVVEAAHDLFVRHGFAGTTIAAVAAAAGVSTPTVYAGFSSKVQLLKSCIDIALAGDDEAVSIAERPLSRWVFGATTAPGLLSRYAVMMGRLAEQAAPIYAVLVRASDAEPQLRELLADLEGQRLTAARRVAGAVRDLGGLPAGRTADQAAELIWVTAAPETFTQLTRVRGWSTRQYVDWARATLLCTVLSPPRTDRVPTPPSEL